MEDLREPVDFVFLSLQHSDGGYAYEDGFHDGYSNKRDSMGRYTRHDGRDHIIARVGEMMSVAETEDERKALEKCLRELRG